MNIYSNASLRKPATIEAQKKRIHTPLKASGGEIVEVFENVTAGKQTRGTIS